MWNGEDTQLLGQMENCVDDFMWAADEELVIITTIETPAPCEESYAWLADLRTNRLDNLLPREGPSIHVLELSPNGQMLLYRAENHLYTLELANRTSTQLEIPDVSGGQWLNDDRIVATYEVDPEEPFAVGMYDLPTEQLEELVSPIITPSLEGMRMSYIEPSPDGRWLAFAAGRDFYQMEGLWLLGIEGQSD